MKSLCKVSFILWILKHGDRINREKHLLALSCLSVRLTANITASAIGGNFVTFDIGELHKTLLINSRFGSNQTTISGTSHAD